MTAPADITTFDGTVISGIISNTAHTWIADSTGLFHTAADLGAEWRDDYAVMLAGHGDTLSALQRLEGNAEAVLDNTAAAKLSAAKLVMFREDLQREFDAIDSAMRTNQTRYGIDPTRPFNTTTYLKMEQTLQADEGLKELGYQGHGVNSPPATRYRGFTSDFQNRTDAKTFYVGGGPGNGENAIATFLDDDMLTHAPFPVVLHNGVLTQLNQNGNLEDPLTKVIDAANAVTFTRVLVASDFSLIPTAVGEVRLVPNAKSAPDQAAPPATLDRSLDVPYYVQMHPDVAGSGMSAVAQYDTVGWTLGANPNAVFDTNFYLSQNTDVRAAKIDPLAHFEANGWREGRDPSLLFSDAKYLAANPDVKAAGLDPMLHYILYGRAEGRATFLSGGTAAADPLVNTAYYDKQLGATLIPTGAAGAQQAAWSYDTSGWQRGLNPNAFFDTAYYLSHNADVAAAHIDPLKHYEQNGWREGRDPSAQFSTAKYLTAYADVKAAGVDPLAHFIVNGQGEGRTAFAV